VDLSVLCADTVNNGDAFSHLVYYALQSFHKSLKLSLEEVLGKLDREGMFHFQVDEGYGPKNYNIQSFGREAAEDTIKRFLLLANDGGVMLERRYYADCRDESIEIVVVRKPSHVEAKRCTIKPDDSCINEIKLTKRDTAIRSRSSPYNCCWKR
jgi:hypothetical protein